MSNLKDFLSLGGDGVPANLLEGSSNIVLTADQAGALTLNPSASINVYLPDATTIDKVQLFVFKNISLFTVNIFNAAGEAVLQLEAGAYALTWCHDTTTLNGGWTVNVAMSSIAGSTFAYTTEASTGGPAFLALDESRILVMYPRQSNGGIAALVVTLGVTVSLGAEYLVQPAGVAAYPKGGALINTDKVLMLFESGGVKVQVLTINGTVITANAAFTVEATPYAQSQIAKIATDVAVVYARYGYGTSYAFPLTVSGTTVTKGGHVQVEADDPDDGWSRDCKMFSGDPGYVVMAVKRTYSTYLGLYILKWSGTALSMSFNSPYYESGSGAFGMVRLSPLKYVIAFNAALRVVNVTVNGTLGTAMASVPTNGANGTPNASSLTMMAEVSSDEFMASPPGTGTTYHIRANGNNTYTLLKTHINSGFNNYKLVPALGKVIFVSSTDSRVIGTLYKGVAK